MIKALNKVAIKRLYLNLVQAINEKPTTSIIPSSEN
jgi:hypothetical protein